MGLGIVNRNINFGIASEQDIKNEIHNILKKYGIDDDYLPRTEIVSLFKHYRDSTVIPEMISMLKILYDGDTESLKKDLMIAKLLEGR